MTNPSSIRRVETRKKIIDAALNIIMTRGEADITMTDVYREANISRTSIYRHFSSTKEILFSAFEYVKSSFEKGMYQAIADKPSAEDRLDVVVEYLSSFLNTQVAQNLNKSNPTYLRQLGAMNFNLRQEMYKKVLEPFFDMVERETGSQVDRDVVAYFITHYYSSLVLYEGQSRPEKIDSLLRKLIRGLSYLDARP